MSNLLRVITVDPYFNLITEDKIEDSLKGLQGAIGDRQIELVYFDNDNIMYVDQEGLFVEDQKFFIYDGLPFAGKAIILGNDSEHGKNKSTKLIVTDIAKKITFATATKISSMRL